MLSQRGEGFLEEMASPLGGDLVHRHRWFVREGQGNIQRQEMEEGWWGMTVRATV